MNSGRRFAAAVVTAVLSLGVVGIGVGPAHASRDTTWPRPIADSAQAQTQPVTDTTWPKAKDTTWPSGS